MKNLKSYSFNVLQIFTIAYIQQLLHHRGDKPAHWNANVRQKAYRSLFLQKAEGHPELPLLLTEIRQRKGSRMIRL